MPEFIIAYHGGREPASPEEGAKHMERWQAWVVSLGDAAVNPGTPLGKSKIVSATGVSDAGPDALTGFTIVNADDMDAALEIAQACPFVEIGSVEVAQVMSM
jgi:hypothetical protein